MTQEKVVLMQDFILGIIAHKDLKFKPESVSICLIYQAYPKGLIPSI